MKYVLLINSISVQNKFKAERTRVISEIFLISRKQGPF